MMVYLNKLKTLRIYELDEGENIIYIEENYN